jgi:cytidylate kinase
MAIITISRGTFTGGKAVAEELQKRLGYPCLGRKELLDATRKQFDIPDEELRETINEPPHFWRQMAHKRLAVLKCITAVLVDYTKDGNLIYHGHAGHLLLNGIPNILRIRIIADMPYRLKAAKQYHGLEGDEAVAYIEKKDKDRNKWARFFYGIDLSDPHLYDVTFNLERNNVEDICDSIIPMTQLDQYKTTNETMKTLENFTLATKVWANIAKDKHTRAASINVIADNGVVTITGKVSSEKMATAMTALAREVNGVKEVKNETGIGTDWYW